MDNRRQVEALRAANRGMARAVCQGAKTAKRYAALGAGMEVDAQGYGREPTAMVRGVLSCLFVCLFLTLSAYRGLNRYRSLSVASRHFTVKIDRQMTMAKDKTREQQTNAGSGVTIQASISTLLN